MKEQHQIFFDNTCKLCQNAVRKIQERDKKGIFEFFPLNSKKAKDSLPKKILSEDTLVLIEKDGNIWIRSKAIFRILKLLEGKYRFLGFLCYVPGLDFFYRIVARNRHFFS